MVRNSETGNLMLRNRRFLRKDLNFQTPIVQGQVLNAIKQKASQAVFQEANKVKTEECRNHCNELECDNVMSILKSCHKRKGATKNVTFATQEQQIEEEVSKAPEDSQAAAVEEESSVTVEERLHRYIKEGVLVENPSSEQFASRTYYGMF